MAESGFEILEASAKSIETRPVLADWKIVMRLSWMID
jgi:hypothetical protein